MSKFFDKLMQLNMSRSAKDDYTVSYSKRQGVKKVVVEQQNLTFALNTDDSFAHYRENRDYSSQSTISSIGECTDTTEQFVRENQIDSDCDDELAEKLANSFKEPKKKNNDSSSKDLYSPPNQSDNNLEDDSGYTSPVSTPERRQSQESVTNTSQEVEGLVQSTPIKQPRKEGGDEYLLNSNVSMISKSNSMLEENIEPVISELVDSDAQIDLHKKSYVLSCIAGGCIGLAVAYFVGAAALTSVYVAAGTFIVMALAGALLGYSIAKLCENKVETKIESPCVAAVCSVKELAI